MHKVKERKVKKISKLKFRIIILARIKIFEMAYQMFSQDVTVMGIKLDGEAKRGLASARAMSYLLKKHFDRIIAKQKTIQMQIQKVPDRV